MSSCVNIRAPWRRADWLGAATLFAVFPPAAAMEFITLENVDFAQRRNLLQNPTACVSDALRGLFTERETRMVVEPVRMKPHRKVPLDVYFVYQRN